MSLSSLDTAICNLALTHLGVGTEIGNAETEKSAEAMACRRVYTLARTQTLSDFPWNFATKTAALALIEESPNDEWLYSYQYPSDCLDFQRMVRPPSTLTANDVFVSAGQLAASSTRQVRGVERIPFSVESNPDDEGKLLVYTDLVTAYGKYTRDVTASAIYPADFQMALSFRVAALIAPRVTGGDPFKLGQRALGLYEIEVSKAMAASANEEQPDPAPDSEMIRARE